MPVSTSDRVDSLPLAPAVASAMSGLAAVAGAGEDCPADSQSLSHANAPAQQPAVATIHKQIAYLPGLTIRTILSKRQRRRLLVAVPGPKDCALIDAPAIISVKSVKMVTRTVDGTVVTYLDIATPMAARSLAPRVVELPLYNQRAVNYGGDRFDCRSNPLTPAMYTRCADAANLGPGP